MDLDATSHFYKIITTDGASVAFSAGGLQLDVYIDIDGPNKGSYTLGKDIFLFMNQDADGNWADAIYPFGNYHPFAKLIVNLYSNGDSAANWVINYDNMDYLQLVDENGKCKNKNTMTESNPRCK